MTTTQTQPGLLAQILDYSNRANPYPLYAELRKTPVFRAPNGAYVVSTYREIWTLMHDPRISAAGNPDRGAGARNFIGMDPPEHDRLRRVTTSHFEQTEAVRPAMVRTATELIDRMKGRQQVDLVDDFAYPFPVSMICQQLGVPHEDEPRFHPWAEAIITQLDPRPGNQAAAAQAMTEMNQYMAELVERFRAQPGPGLLSALANEEGMSTPDIVATGRLVLIAGHETTVNLIANGMLTLFRHPDIMDRLRREPDLSVSMVEELLRYEPPVQINPKYVTLDDIEVAGVTLPKGSHLVLALAAANRDPERFAEPERFDPERTNNEHLGFFTGIHYCFGAGLARQEAQVALIELTRRLQNPRLLQDPPPYRPNPTLRGPRHLPVAIDGLAD
ncbi:MAG: cytochrome P450 [Chloroflexi bacterium]|nr:cytochrome P450 [Chloroflexota bacterium]